MRVLSERCFPSQVPVQVQVQVHTSGSSVRAAAQVRRWAMRMTRRDRGPMAVKAGSRSTCMKTGTVVWCRGRRAAVHEEEQMRAFQIEDFGSRNVLVGCGAEGSRTIIEQAPSSLVDWQLYILPIGTRSRRGPRSARAVSPHRHARRRDTHSHAAISLSDSIRACNQDDSASSGKPDQPGPLALALALSPWPWGKPPASSLQRKTRCWCSPDSVARGQQSQPPN